MIPAKSKATVQRLRTQGGSLCRLKGVIDETFRGEDLVSGSFGVVVIDLGEVKQITSFGIREWIGALRQLSADYYCFVKVPPAVVSQLAMVAGFAGQGEVISFQAPYLCAHCHTERSLVLDLRRSDHLEAVCSAQPPPVSCSECGEQCDFDDYAPHYFQYFMAAPRPNPPWLANAIIDGKTLQTGFHIKKDVTDVLTALWMSGNMNAAGYFKRLADGLDGAVVFMLADVDGVTEEGLAGFIKSLGGLTCPCYLAGVPAFLVLALLQYADALGQAKLVSVSIPLHCARCDGEVRAELGIPTLREFAENGVFEAYCVKCAHPLARPAPGDWLDATLALPGTVSPAIVMEYFAVYKSGTPAQTSTDHFMSSEVASSYQIRRRIGRGGMGEIYLARQVGPAGFKKSVVIKRIAPERFEDSDSVEQFLQEARLTARLSHPNIVQIFELGRAGGEYFLAMEYVDGLDLRAIIATCREHELVIPLSICCRIIMDLCQALHAAHNLHDEVGTLTPIIHRDISPGNVLISTDGIVKLTDFGIAKSSQGVPQETEPRLIKGTARFIAPESLARSTVGQVHPRIDVYGTGVLLYECLTCRPLFPGASWANTFHQITNMPIPELANQRADVSPQLEQVFQRAVSRDPEKRYQTIAEMHEGIHQAISEIDAAASIAQMADWMAGIIAKRPKAPSLTDHEPTEQVLTVTTNTDPEGTS